MKQRRLKGMFARHAGPLMPPLAPPQEPIQVESSDDDEDIPQVVPF